MIAVLGSIQFCLLCFELILAFFVSRPGAVTEVLAWDIGRALAAESAIVAPVHLFQLGDALFERDYVSEQVFDNPVATGDSAWQIAGVDNGRRCREAAGLRA